MAARTRSRSRSGSTRRPSAPRAARPGRREREPAGTGEGEDGEHERRGPRPFWSGTISFGLVSVPVELYSAVRGAGVALRMLARDGTPLQRRYFCPEEERDVPYEELVRGYEVAPEEHVILTDEELEALAPRASRDIELRRFVPQDEVDPFLFESSYVLAPSGESPKAYRLLAEVMEREQRAGIATFVMREKEYLVAIFARAGVLHAQTLRFSDEIRSAKDAGIAKAAKTTPELVRAFTRALEKLPEGLDPRELEDPETERLRELVERKRRRGTDVVEGREVADEGDDGEVPSDLLAALKRSLAGRTRAQRAPRRSKAKRGKKAARRARA